MEAGFSPPRWSDSTEAVGAIALSRAKACSCRAIEPVWNRYSLRSNTQEISQFFKAGKTRLAQREWAGRVLNIKGNKNDEVMNSGDKSGGWG